MTNIFDGGCQCQAYYSFYTLPSFANESLLRLSIEINKKCIFISMFLSLIINRIKFGGEI